MIRTRITELFGIEHPIIGGTMMYLSRAPLVAAISNGGGLGILASAIFKERASFRDELRKIRELTDKPFAVNLNLFPMLCPIDVHEYLDVILEEKVGIVETSGMSLPEELTKEIKAAGLKWMHKCVGPRYAAKAAKLGADAVTVVGWENGGATGNLDLTTMVVVPATREAVEIPVIGGGGIADGRGVAAVLALGADAAIVGTRFVLAEECPVHPAVKEKLLHASSLDTVLVMKAINMTHRVLVNEAAKKVLELDAKQGDLMEYAALCDGKAAARLYFNGELDIGMTYCSQAIGLMNDVRPAAEIVRSMAEEAALILRRYAP